MEKYKVICQKCGGNDILAISPDNRVTYTEHTPIIAARYRPDMNWGFECTCGQDSRIAPEEKDKIPMLVRGGDHAIAAITKALTPKNELKFKMERIGG